jgi:hypothetical protein
MRCGIVAVTQAEEMPVQEVLEMREALRTQVKKDPEALIVNGLYPEAPVQTDQEDDALVALWRRRRELNEREMARLRASWSGPCFELPQLALDRGPRLTETLQRCLERAADSDQGSL